jgi:chorismate mutase
MKKNNLLSVNEWFEKDSSKPLIIAGPCSAETEEQVLATAKAIKDIGKVSVYRAGIWKPRTRPGEFEGAGAEGLKWLKRVKEETGMPVATEVATSKHIEEALKAGIDVLWIGARTTVNPFSIQELADALQGVDIPVFVKNPVNPDLGLWIGAVERFSRAGLQRIGAIHRGFSSYEKTAFRNEPMWELAVKFRIQCPDIPMIVDPSHICGNRELIQYVSQRAMDLDMRGLMIETHISPQDAWTDAKQQITPDALVYLLDNLILRTSKSSDIEFVGKLEQLRRDIDKIDEQIIQRLSERMNLSEQIGTYKRDNDITILQIRRWEEIINQRKAFAEALNLEDNFILKLFELVHNESIRRQANIINSTEK